jgi:hypothetical protein
MDPGRRYTGNARVLDVPRLGNLPGREGARPARLRSFTPGKALRRLGGVKGGACAIASATPSAPLMPLGRCRTIPGTCEGTEVPAVTADGGCVRGVLCPFRSSSRIRCGGAPARGR